jgi:3-deoxy-manno-octulosonate cytidylyltransferase (CMP-KDO synthetase)
MSVIAVIPARLQSKRFPRKVLANIHGHPMLWHVFQRVSAAKSITDVWILSDDQDVVDQSLSWGAKAIITSEDCPSGTDRIASVIDYFDADIIINVQGDEPLIPSEVIDRLAMEMEGSEADLATPVFPINAIEDLTNPNVVKVVRGANGSALYFSRSPVPHVRGINIDDWLNCGQFWGHAGVYAYRKETLAEFPTLPTGKLETLEKLEQLRLLEAGKKILTVEIDYRPQAVDVPEDLETVKRIMAPGSQIS